MTPVTAAPGRAGSLVEQFPLSIGPRPAPPGVPYRACDENPLAGIAAAGS